MKRIIPILFSLVLCFSCQPTWTSWERKVINASDSVMYITVIQADSSILRTPSRDLSKRELASPELATLIAKMYSTVTDPSQDGVGIAAPQVGINRRIIWLQRYDKPQKPFECYLNVKIDSLYGEIVRGPEGCLSVPPMRGIVPRYSTVKVSYYSPETRSRVSETVEGYSAIIFQHECDHLDGILYIDRADTVFVSESWAAERESFTYTKPEWF